MSMALDKPYIDNAVDELVNLLGDGEEVPAHELVGPLAAKKTQVTVEKIARFLGLPVKTRLTLINSCDAKNRFDTKAVVPSNSKSGVQGITAQVSIPSNLPLYGSQEMEGFSIDVKISDNCNQHPEAFISIMAHELSHIVLHSILSKHKNNEIYTDLTAMILGFSTIMRHGREVEDCDIVDDRGDSWTVRTTTTKYGYLSDYLFDIAYSNIQYIRKTRKDTKEMVAQQGRVLQKRILYQHAELLHFKRLLEYLDNNTQRKFRKQDATRIVELHQTNYSDDYLVLANKTERLLAEIGLLDSIVLYTPARNKHLHDLSARIGTVDDELAASIASLMGDVRILRRQIGIISRLLNKL